MLADQSLFGRHCYAVHGHRCLKGWEGRHRTSSEYMRWLVYSCSVEPPSRPAADGTAIHAARPDVMRSHESNSVFGYAQSIQIASDFNR